jgi:hypothetical protein
MIGRRTRQKPTRKDKRQVGLHPPAAGRTHQLPALVSGPSWPDPSEPSLCAFPSPRALRDSSLASVGMAQERRIIREVDA